MTKLDDRDLDRLLGSLDLQPDSWQLQILRRRILIEAGKRKSCGWLSGWRFEPALVAAMLLGLVLGSALPLDNFFEDQGSMVRILQLSEDQFSIGG